MIVFPFWGFSQEIYVYPSLIDINSTNKCTCREQLINNFTDSIKKELDSPYKGIIDILKVDLNFDSKCELILKYQDREAYPNNTPCKIFKIDNNNISEIGFFFWENVVFASKSNGYYQILSKYFEGHKTNPTYYLQVFHFDGKSYSLIKIPYFTIGQYQDLGKQSYDNKKYGDAEKYYHNAYTMSKVFKDNQILDANNLALVWIKQNKFDNAKSILLETISTLKDGYYNKKELAPIYYNLGLIEENKNNFNDALDFYRKSNSYDYSKMRDDKIQNIIKKINGQ